MKTNPKTKQCDNVFGESHSSSLKSQRVIITGMSHSLVAEQESAVNVMHI